MIGACFPRDKFIALKSLVVFGLDVSSDFRLALAFPAKIMTLKSLVVLVDGSVEKSFKIMFASALEHSKYECLNHHSWYIAMAVPHGMKLMDCMIGGWLTFFA